MKACSNLECRGDCTWCNRAPVENRPLPPQDAVLALRSRGCDDRACLGDCTWCNRAEVENRPLPRQVWAKTPVALPALRPVAAYPAARPGAEQQRPVR